MEAIATKLEAIAVRLEAIAIRFLKVFFYPLYNPNPQLQGVL